MTIEPAAGPAERAGTRGRAGPAARAGAGAPRRAAGRRLQEIRSGRLLICRRRACAPLGKTLCWFCGVDIVVYYHKGYRGTRGRCPKCGVDFPLE